MKNTVKARLRGGERPGKLQEFEVINEIKYFDKITKVWLDTEQPWDSVYDYDYYEVEDKDEDGDKIIRYIAFDNESYNRDVVFKCSSLGIDVCVEDSDLTEKDGTYRHMFISTEGYNEDEEDGWDELIDNIMFGLTQYFNFNDQEYRKVEKKLRLYFDNYEN